MIERELAEIGGDRLQIGSRLYKVEGWKKNITGSGKKRRVTRDKKKVQLLNIGDGPYDHGKPIIIDWPIKWVGYSDTTFNLFYASDNQASRA